MEWVNIRICCLNQIAELLSFYLLNILLRDRHKARKGEKAVREIVVLQCQVCKTLRYVARVHQDTIWHYDNTHNPLLYIYGHDSQPSLANPHDARGFAYGDGASGGV